MRVLVFGPFSGYASYPVVMRGLAGALEAHGLEVVRADVSGPNGDISADSVRSFAYGTVPVDVPVDRVLAMKPTFQMTKGLFVAGLPVSGLFVGDVSEVPNDWQLAMRFCEQVVVPSSWMAEVMPGAFVANHGIEPEYLGERVSPTPELPFRWIHFCSAGVYPQRKGTPQALMAFEKLPGDHRLTLVVPELRRGLRRLLEAMCPDVRERVEVVTRSQGTSVQGMIELYQSHHVLLAPSRAEGFGIQPLEARALGVPVVQTCCTGFADHGLEHDARGVAVVPHGELEQAWGDFGEAPRVSSEDVYYAMTRMVDNYESYKDAAVLAAPDMKRWSWFETTRGLAERIKS